MATEMTAPDFDQLTNLFIEEGAVSLSPSELHGALVGQLAAGKRHNAEGLEKFCADQLDIAGLNHPSSQPQLSALYREALAQLESSNFELKLLLPEEDQPLSARAEHLGLWVAGFLAGFGLAVTDKAGTLGTEAQESLKDLVQIAQIDADAEGEEEESLLVEVEEYVRMAAMLLFTECNVAAEQSEKPARLH